MAALITALTGSLFLSGKAHACTSPAGVAGSFEWFAGDNAFRYCNGTTWQVIGASGLWTQNGAHIYYNTGNAGIGVTNPAAKLDVNGSVRLSSQGLACNGTTEGTLRYTSSTKTIDFCDGTSWKQMGGQQISTCAIAEYTTAGEYSYTVVSGCEKLVIEAYGAGGGAAGDSQGGGGGGSSRVERLSDSTLYALGAGGGGGGSEATASNRGGGGGGGFGKKTITLTAGENLRVVVGGGGQNGCLSVGGAGGSPSGGTGGNSTSGGNSTYGGGGGGDSSIAGGDSTYGGGGGGGSSANNNVANTNYGGAGGADMDVNSCGTTINGAPCGGASEGGGGGGGIGDIALVGMSGDRFAGGTAANGGPGAGATYTGTLCPAGGADGKVVIRPGPP